MGISAKGAFLGWLGCWINNKQIIFSYDNWVFGDWRMDKKKNGFHVGLASDSLLCYK